MLNIAVNLQHVRDFISKEYGMKLEDFMEDYDWDENDILFWNWGGYGYYSLKEEYARIAHLKSAS